MANFDAQITDLIGGTIDQTACDQWAADACKEIINQLPAKLKAKCSTISIINATNGTTLDLDGIGDILSVTRLSANSGGYYKPCREIPAQYGDLANDSTDLNYYATASDPVYYITSNSSDVATLFVKPTTTDAQPANAYHITYPTVDVSGVSTIANFPDEAEALVVLYAAIRQLLQYQNTMTTSWQADITTAIDAVNTALDRIAAHNWGDTGNFQNGDLIKVKDALDNAQNLIDNNAPASSYDAYDQLQNEDLELMSGALQIASTEMNRASAHLSEWSALGGMAIQEANGFIAEASSRLQLETTKYSWYGDQYAKLTAEYARGLAALKGA